MNKDKIKLDINIIECPKCKVERGKLFDNPYTREEHPEVCTVCHRELRREYLEGVADNYGVDFFVVVLPLADLFGRNEDFDGLIAMLEDMPSVMEYLNDR